MTTETRAPVADRLLAPAIGEVITRLPEPPQVPHLIQSDEEALVIAANLATEFAQMTRDRDRERLLPWDEVESFTASGLGGILVPRDYGGADVSIATVVEVFARLGAADAALGQIPQNQFGVLALLRDLPDDAFKARIFADVLAGHRIGNAGPERGRRAMTHNLTHLRRVDGSRRLFGERYYATSSAFAHWIPTRAADEDGRPVQVWVRRDAPGVTIVDDWTSFGQRTTASGTVRFDGVSVEDRDIVEVYRLVDRPGLAGPISQIIHVAIDLGIARAAIEDAAEFVRAKARPWVDSGLERATDDPTIVHVFGELATDLHAAESVTFEAAETIERIRTAPVTAETSAEASIAVAEAKILTTEIALKSAEKLFDVAGSSATRAGHDLDRHWRNARVHTLHDPVRWKFHLIGNYELNGVLPARHQWN